MKQTRRIFYIKGDGGSVPGARPLDLVVWDGRLFLVGYDGHLVRVV